MSEIASLLPGVPLIESPLFDLILPEIGLNETETALAQQLHSKGYAVFDFPDAELDQRIERIIANLGPHYDVDFADPASNKFSGKVRIQDAWQWDDDVRAIATNQAVMDLLSKLYCRKAFPFQTLNFPVGTQQHLHSDSIHFSSLPERFMCGVWLAMEDIHAENGPLVYCPGSQQWPIISNMMVDNPRYGSNSPETQEPYEPVWRAMIAAKGAPLETFLARKGQALIWAANLLHGGAPQIDPTRTRWSQVTHYYFENCTYYTPAFSEEPLGKLDLRQIQNIATGAIMPNRLFNRDVLPPDLPPPSKKKWWQRRK